MTHFNFNETAIAGILALPRDVASMEITISNKPAKYQKEHEGKKEVVQCLPIVFNMKTAQSEKIVVTERLALPADLPQHEVSFAVDPDSFLSAVSGIASVSDGVSMELAEDGKVINLSGGSVIFPVKVLAGGEKVRPETVKDAVKLLLDATSISYLFRAFEQCALTENKVEIGGVPGMKVLAVDSITPTNTYIQCNFVPLKGIIASGEYEGVVEAPALEPLPADAKASAKRKAAEARAEGTKFAASSAVTPLVVNVTARVARRAALLFRDCKEMFIVFEQNTITFADSRRVYRAAQSTCNGANFLRCKALAKKLAADGFDVTVSSGRLSKALDLAAVHAKNLRRGYQIKAVVSIAVILKKGQKEAVLKMPGGFQVSIAMEAEAPESMVAYINPAQYAQLMKAYRNAENVRLHICPAKDSSVVMINPVVGQKPDGTATTIITGIAKAAADSVATDVAKAVVGSESETDEAGEEEE